MTNEKIEKELQATEQVPSPNEVTEIKDKIKATPVPIPARSEVLQLLASEGMIMTVKEEYVTDAYIIAAQHKVIADLVEDRQIRFDAMLETDNKLRSFYREALRNGFVVKPDVKNGPGAITLQKAV